MSDNCTISNAQGCGAPNLASTACWPASAALPVKFLDGWSIQCALNRHPGPFWCAVVFVVAVAGTVPGVGLVRVVAEVGAGGYWCWGMCSGCRWDWWMVWNSFCIFQVVQTLWNLIMKNSISGNWTLKIAVVVMLLFAAPLGLRGTGLDADLIYVNGEKWALLAKPVSGEMLKKLDAVLPPHEQRVISTANWSGITCIWSIEKGKLYLKRVEVEMVDSYKDKVYTFIVPADSLKDVFEGCYTRRGILAKWVDGELRAGQGNLVSYSHIGFARNHKKEIHFKVNKGIVESLEQRRYSVVSISQKKEYKGRKLDYPAVRVLKYRTQPFKF